nr:hypothetical protein [uncultured Nitrososphaera sp.]
MRILLYTNIDINAQAQQLSEYIRENTDHEALNVVLNQTYIDRKADKILGASENFTLKSEEWDFFILRFFDAATIRKLAQTGVVNANNCIIKIHGSEARFNQAEWRALWEDFRITYVVNGYDYYNWRQMGSCIQHIPHMVDVSRLEEYARKENRRADRLVVGHAPTNTKIKNTEAFENAVKELQAEGVPIEAVTLTNKPWEQVIQAKANCHVIYDQMNAHMGFGGFGINMVEALAMRQPVVAGYSKYTYSYYPQLRRFVTQATPETIKGVLNYLVKYFKVGNYPMFFSYDGRSKEPQKFAYERFSTGVVGSQWLDLIEFIAEGGVSNNFGY